MVDYWKIMDEGHTMTKLSTEIHHNLFGPSAQIGQLSKIFFVRNLIITGPSSMEESKGHMTA